MAEIPLSQGKVAIVDFEDYAELSKHKWWVTFHDGKWYAVRNREGKTLLMHRYIMKAQKGQQIDHWDGDGLNNCRYNLRFSTQQQNVFNQKPTGKGTSKYKGVSKSKGADKWYACIKFNGKTINLGLYQNEADAALAYDAAAKCLFGVFARTNDPKERIGALSQM